MLYIIYLFEIIVCVAVCIRVKCAYTQITKHTNNNNKNEILYKYGDGTINA